MALVCTHCGVTTAFTAVELRTQTEYEEGYITQPAVFEGRDHRPKLAVIVCQDCGRLFVARKGGLTGEWQTVWPLPKKKVPEEVPEAIHASFAEALLCLAAGAFEGCLMMCRTTLIRLHRDQEVQNLKGLVEKGKISQMLYEQADEVRLWANVVGHEDYDLDLLTGALCGELVTYVESLLDAVYVQPARLARHRELRNQAKSSSGHPN